MALLLGIDLGTSSVKSVLFDPHTDLNEACAQVVNYGPPTQPDATRHAQYNQLYEQFTTLYPRLKNDFHWLATFTSTAP